MTDKLNKPNCEECTLKGTQVNGRGCSSNPIVAFIGEAPGADEIRQGRPFVGAAGRVIQQLIEYVGFSLDEVYFTNLCLCRPPENRDPTAQEIRCCWGRLTSELAKINPQYIVTLGAIPSKTMFGRYISLNKHRSHILEATTGHQGIITYHPAALLYPGGESLFPFVLSDLQKLHRSATGGSLPNDLVNPNTHVVVIDTPELMGSLVDRLSTIEPGVVAFDWETTGTSPLWDSGICLSLSWKPGTAVVIPIKMIRIYHKQLAQALSSDGIVLTGFNAVMFDAKFNEKYGLPANICEDPMLVHYLLDERPQKRSLENLSREFLDAPSYETEMLTKYDCGKDEMLQKIPEEVIYEYCGKDADWTLRLAKYFGSKHSKEQGLLYTYKNILIPGARAFADIQQYGFWIDQFILHKVTADYEKQLDTFTTELDQLTGTTFNPRSHPQVQGFLWDELRLEEPELYGRLPRSADKATLEALLEQYPKQPFVNALMGYRSAYTIYSRYLRKMPDYIEQDGRIRTSYHFDRTETGRLSTTNPAIHQIPRESAVRSIFSAPPGYVLIQADYAQIEIRMAAHVAQDTKLTELLRSGVDFHTMMASQAFQVPLEQVTKNQRQAAKAVSFGLLYLMGDQKLADSTGLPPSQASKFVASYKNLMPGVQAWIEETKRQVRSQRYVESIFKRRRRFPFITDRNLAALQREAVNFPVQSGASDLTLSSIIRLHSVFKQAYPEVKIVAMVHDSIVVECPEHISSEVGKLVHKIMESPPFTTDVPFPVEVIVGQHWGEGEILAIGE